MYVNHFRGLGNRLTYLSISLLSLSLLACGGGSGGSNSATNSSSYIDDSKAPSSLFAGDTNNGAIGSLVDNNPSIGTYTVERIINGSNTSLGLTIDDMSYDDVRDQLYVAHRFSVLAFSNAGRVNGNVPSRVITTTPTDNLYALTIDKTNNVLYVADKTNIIKIYNSASVASSASPDRSISINPNDGTSILSPVPGGNIIPGIQIDPTRDILYVSSMNTGAPVQRINIFDNASTLSGSAIPDRVISLSEPIFFGCNLFIDEINDRLYVSTSNGHIWVYDAASTLNSSATPDRIINLPILGNTKITVNISDDILYAASSSQIYIIENASTTNGGGASLSMKQILAPIGSSFSSITVRQ